MAEMSKMMVAMDLGCWVMTDQSRAQNPTNKLGLDASLSIVESFVWLDEVEGEDIR